MQFLLLRVEQLQQAVAVGKADIGPDGGMAGGDAGEIAKARAGIMQGLCAQILIGDGVHIAVGDEVGQMADHREYGIVCGWRQLRHHGARGLPQAPHLLVAVGVLCWMRAQNQLFVFKQAKLRRHCAVSV